MDGDGWGLLVMYMVADFEIVHSIYLACTCIFLPNLRSTSFFVMYSDVLRLTIILVFKEKIYEKLMLVLISSGSTAALPLAGRKTLA
jgi:hypothetical protein